MSPRHLSRAITLQVLFMWDFNDQDFEHLDFYIDYNLQEFSSSILDKNFIIRLAKSVINQQTKIDELINRYTKEWPVERLTVLDRNILRLAIYEMFNSQDVPTKVALNEAVELAKDYSGEPAQKFVSGVLGAIYENYFKNKI
jgi:N utilization substance protein B